MADNSVKQDIRDMRGMLQSLIAGQADTNRGLKDLNERLFNGGNGAIPVAFRSISDLRKDTEKKLADNEKSTLAVKNRVDKIYWYTAGVAGALAVVGTIASKIFHKLGWI